MSSVDAITVTSTSSVNQITITSTSGISVTTVGTQGLAGPSEIMGKEVDSSNTAGASDNGAVLIYNNGTSTWTASTLSSSQSITQNIYNLRLNGANVTVTSILDEDNMVSDSATALATQQSIKKYVDDNNTVQDLDIIDDSGNQIDVRINNETLGLLGGTGISSVASGTGVTFNIDATVVTLTGTQTLTNKTLTSPALTTPLLNTSISGSAFLDEDDFASNSANKVASQQSIKAYVDTKLTAEDLDITDGTNSGAIDLDSEVLGILGGTGLTSSLSGNNITLAIDSTVTTLTGTQTLTNKTLTTPKLNGSVAITTTGTEINVLDGNTSGSSVVLVDADQFIVNDSGTMKQIAVTRLDTYFSGTTATLTNKTLTAPVVNNGVLNTGLSGSAFLDEDDLSSNSATKVASQQSIKAYVDANITAQDLDVTDGSTNIAIDLDSETLSLLGGTGIDSTASGNGVTFAIDNTVATLVGSQTLTNKTINVDNNTVSNIELDNLKSGVLDTDLSSVASTDTTIASAKAIKTYVDANITAQDLDITDGSATIAIDLDSETLSLLGGTGVTSTASGNGVTLAIGQSVATGDNVVFNQVTAALVGNSSTATALQTSRAIALSGDVVGTANFNGTAGISISTTIQANSVALGTDTTGSYVSSLVAGTGVTLANNSGETATPRITIGQAVGTSDNVSFGTVTASLSGNASTATALQTARTIGGTSFNGTANIAVALSATATALATARTIALSGDVTASGVSFDGTGNITLSTTIAANSVALGTDTTGNYVAAITGSSNEIEVTNSGGENRTVNIGLPDNVIISGNLTVNGTTTTTDTNELHVTDPLIKLAKDNTSNSLDIGFYGQYRASGSANQFAGLFRDQNDSGKFKLFELLQAEPTTTVNTSGTGYQTATLVANLEGNVAGNLTGTIQTAAQGNITSLGTLTALQVDNLNINGNTISSTAGTDLNITPLSGQQIVLDGTIIIDAGVVTGATSITSTSFVGALTGNASGTSATVTGAAQTAITSVGTLTALQVDNININGNTISSTAGTDLNITPLTGQQIVLDGAIVIDAGVVTGATSITSTAFVGDVTGDISGNAGTATVLATARTIGGTSFNGSANIEVALANTSTILATSRNFSVSGDITASAVAFNGASNVVLSASIDDNVVGAAQLNISGNGNVGQAILSDGDGSFSYGDASKTTEQIQDIVGGMVTGNTETGITVTYEDGDGTLDFVINPAQTTITSLLATDIKIGEDDQTKIDFETADEIHFYAANAQQIKLIDGAIVPVTNNDIDLGTSSLEFKNAFFDGTVTSDAFAGALTGNVTGDISGNAGTATLLQTARTIGGTSFNGSANIAIALANTATTLATARTIGGVSFDGSANINLAGVNIAGNQDTSGNAGTATALATARTIGGTSFDGTANIAIALANTATTLATARTINGVSFNGSANITTLTAGTGVSVSGTAVSIGQAVATSNSPTFANMTLGGTDSIKVPVGSTGQRNGSPANGMFRYNNTNEEFEGYQNGAWGAIAGGGAAAMETSNHTGNGSTRAFSISTNVVSEDNLVVFVDGVYQNKATFVASGTTVTFDTAPANTRKIVIYHVRSAVAGSSIIQDNFTGNGSTTAYTLSINPTSELNTQIFIDGVYQSKSTYAVSGTTLTFDTAPVNTTAIEVIIMSQTSVNVPTSNSVTTSMIQDANITTDKILNSNVTLAKMAANSVDSNQYVDGSIDTAHIADSQITSAKIANGTIATADIADDAITSAKLDTNIAIAGTLGSTGKITADAGIDIDNFNIDGTTIALSSGDMTLDVAGNIILDADGGDVSFLDGGTETLRYSSSGAGPQFFSPVADKDIIFKGKDGSSTITALTLDMSDAGTATFNHDINLSGDIDASGQIFVGGQNSTFAENNLRFLSGGAAYIDHSTVGQDFIFRTSASSALDTTALTIQHDGNLLIGGTNPAPVSNNVAGISLRAVNGEAQISVAGAAALYLNRKTNDGALAYFRKDGGTIGTLATAGGDLVIGSHNTCLRFDDSADDILPTDDAGVVVNNTLSLGSASARFKDLYLSSQALVEGGATSAPSFAFTNDTDTGMSRPTTDTLNFVSGGTEMVRVGTRDTGVKLASGTNIGTLKSNNLGISTTATTVLNMASAISSGDVGKGRYLITCCRDAGSVGTATSAIFGLSSTGAIYLYQVLNANSLTFSTAGAEVKVAIDSGTCNVHTNAIPLTVDY